MFFQYELQMIGQSIPYFFSTAFSKSLVVNVYVSLHIEQMFAFFFQIIYSDDLCHADLAIFYPYGHWGQDLLSILLDLVYWYLSLLLTMFPIK